MRLPLLLVALAMVVPSAQAQAPASPAATLAVDLDPGPVVVPLGEGHAFPFQVALSASGFACTEASTATVALSIRDLPSPLEGVEATVPATLEFAVPQGVYAEGLPGVGAYEATLDATLSINITASAPASHEHTFEVTATLESLPCQATADPPAATAAGEHKIKTGPAPSTRTTRGPSSVPAPQSSAPAQESDALASLALGAGLLALAYLRRR